MCHPATERWDALCQAQEKMDDAALQQRRRRAGIKDQSDQEQPAGRMIGWHPRQGGRQDQQAKHQLLHEDRRNRPPDQCAVLATLQHGQEELPTGDEQRRLRRREAQDRIQNGIGGGDGLQQEVPVQAAQQQTGQAATHDGYKQPELGMAKARRERRRVDCLHEQKKQERHAEPGEPGNEPSPDRLPHGEWSPIGCRPPTAGGGRIARASQAASR